MISIPLQEHAPHLRDVIIFHTAHQLFVCSFLTLFIDEMSAD